MDTNSMIFGINKFFFYAMNYPSVLIKFPSIAGGMRKEYLPDFFTAFPDHLKEHFCCKWESACDRYSGYGAMMKFYGELDSSNRKLMLEYIVNNYNDEQKIYF